MRRHHMIGICCLTCFLPFFFSSISFAFNQADLDKVLATKECQWCDLRNADLSKAGLSGALLSGANLSGAKLSGADLSGANLSTAYLRNTDLSGSNLSNAYFSKAILTGAEMKDANMTGANLSEAVWTDGTKCDEGSVKECKHSRPNRAGGRNRSSSPGGSGLR